MSDDKFLKAVLDLQQGISHAAPSAFASIPRGLAETLATQKGISDAVFPRGLAQMLATQKGISDAVFPRGLAETLATQKSISDAVFPRGLAQMLATQKGISDALHQHVSERACFPNESLLASFGATSNFLQGQQQVSALTDMIKGLSNLGLASSIAPFTKLHDAMSHQSFGVRSEWEQHLARSILPTMSVLGRHWEVPVGVLAGFDDHDLGGSLAWVSPEGDDLALAAFMQDGGRLPAISIDVHVQCAFCGDMMLKKDTKFRWRGPQKGRFEVKIIPLCATCQRRSNNDPTYLSRALSEIDRPDLRLISTGGVSDNVPRGKLRLVRTPENDDK